MHAKTVLVITAPGQGAQAPGFLSPWLDVPGVAARLGALSELAGVDLIRCGTTAGSDEIRAIAGVLAPEDALRLVAVRGRAMAGAAAAQPTGMTAVLGGDEATVLASIEAHGLTPANVNGAGQIVAAGTMEQLAAFAADPPAGARLRPLSVAGAFHTVHMAPAVADLSTAASSITVSDPRIVLLSNRDGAIVSYGPDWLARIVAQVATPVRWDACMRTMAGHGATALIELPPAGTLTGLARRGLPGVALQALKTPDDLGTARTLLAEHSDVRAASPATSPTQRRHP